jgi:PAS domain S-box-containing protein
MMAELADLKLAEEKFRLAVEASPSGMVMINRDGRIVMVNAEMEQQFGYLRDELIGRPMDMIVPNRMRAQHICRRNEFFIRPVTHRIGSDRDLLGLRKDGTEFPIEVGLNPIHAGGDLLILAVIVDISERKRMERLKDEFVSTVSHELRAPLTSISGSLGLLMGQWADKLPQQAARLLMIADQNSQRLLRLINDILDIEKIESGHVVFNLSRINVRSVVDQVIETDRIFADGYGVRVRLDPASVDVEVNADPDRLAQVITNLLSNAIKFSPANEEVLVTVERNGAVVRISVRDRGCGIPVGFRSRIFEKFAQADGESRRQSGGTGLGLSIVKQIVERLGGEVGFDDAPDNGTIFYIELPDCSGRDNRETELALDGLVATVRDRSVFPTVQTPREVA